MGCPIHALVIKSLSQKNCPVHVVIAQQIKLYSLESHFSGVEEIHVQ